jgi:hypothetical protein
MIQESNGSLGYAPFGVAAIAVDSYLPLKVNENERSLPLKVNENERSLPLKVNATSDLYP